MNQALAIIAIALGKLAIVAFLQQIHGPEHRGRVILLWGIAISNLIINALTVGMIFTQCTPREKLWDEGLPGTCDGRLRNQNTAYFQGSWSAFCDLILALYPVVFFWNVRLNVRVKVGLCVLMGLGVIACVCSIVKTSYLRVLSQTEDITYYIAQLITWNEYGSLTNLSRSCRLTSYQNREMGRSHCRLHPSHPPAPDGVLPQPHQHRSIRDRTHKYQRQINPTTVIFPRLQTTSAHTTCARSRQLISWPRKRGEHPRPGRWEHHEDHRYQSQLRKRVRSTGTERSRRPGGSQRTDMTEMKTVF